LATSSERSKATSGRASSSAQTQPATRPDYSLAELAILNAAAELVVLIALPSLHRLLRRRSLAALGLQREQFASGARLGLVGIAIAMPLVFWSGVLSELLYQAIGYRHPNAHELLKALGASRDPRMKAFIIGTAVVLAPVFEELIFRGLLQNLLVRLFAGRFHVPGSEVVQTLAPAEAAAASDVDAPAGVGTPMAETGVRGIDSAPAGPIVPVWRIWAAVVLGALIFSSIHEPWSMPPIFVLAVCFGYLYQRSGNLNAVIFMHAYFNLLNTVQFLVYS
jgi:membrane protease YdiL (CAAX protease family)